MVCNSGTGLVVRCRCQLNFQVEKGPAVAIARESLPRAGELKIGLALFSHQSVGTSWISEPYRAFARTAAVAESAGFDSLWASEHHGARDGHLGSPIVALAAAAATTERIDLGTGVAIGPLYHPERLRSDALTLNRLSNGRAVIGLGLGYRQAEYAQFGVQMSTRVRRLRETVTALRRTDDGDPVLRVWLGGYADAAVQRAAEIADGYLHGRGHPAEVGAALSRLDESLERRSRQDFAVASQQVYVLDSPAASRDELLGGLGYQQRTYAAWYQVSGQPGKSRPVEALPPEDFVNGTGTPDDIAEAAAPVLRHLASHGEPHLICRIVFPGLPIGSLDDYIEDFGHRVLPTLRARFATMKAGNA